MKLFILKNFILGKNDISKIKIDKNNFISIYNKWLEAVKPTIRVSNWDIAKKNGIIDGDFYLADLLSAENKTLKEKLFVVLRQTKYVMNRHKNEMGLFTSTEVEFSDNQKVHKSFWAVYERPPREDYWDYIIERRDLLVPQDVRERKGSFFTPGIWVEKSQEYIASVFGENWQDEYYVWDCAAGTGNLLAGLTNKYNIWASTLDKADVDVMHDRIKNGANLLEDHVFQFDFLNDDFSKLPQGLQKIINDEEKRKKLIIYINPPYAEGDNRKGEGRSGVAISKIQNDYSDILGYTKREISFQFIARIYKEIEGCKIGEFSKLKILQSPKFSDFRIFFQASLLKIFICPSDTFDNVKGKFPIGFKIWDTEKKETFLEINTDIYIEINKKANFQGGKKVFSYSNMKVINDWTTTFIDDKKESIGNIIGVANDFQNNNTVCIEKPNKPWNHKYQWQINKNNIIESSIYFTVRHCIEATWINDRDQFLFPNDGWKNDKEFQNDCLAFTLFNGQNNISSKHGINHWIPFTEKEINARDKFDSNFMADFINGKIETNNTENDLFNTKTVKNAKHQHRIFSVESQNVFNAGRKLWQYYHKQPDSNANASLYDIREFFQGRNDKGKMNSKSEDETYSELIGNLRSALKILAKKIEPKVYEYGFLK